MVMNKGISGLVTKSGNLCIQSTIFIKSTITTWAVILRVCSYESRAVVFGWCRLLVGGDKKRLKSITVSTHCVRRTDRTGEFFYRIRKMSQT